MSQQQLLPVGEFPPPDPDAVQVSTPTAAGERRMSARLHCPAATLAGMPNDGRATPLPVCQPPNLVYHTCVPPASNPCHAGRPASRTSESLGSDAASRSSTAGLSGEALRRSQWLGPQLRHPACPSMSLNELALQAVYSEERSRQIGNEPLVQALKCAGVVTMQPSMRCLALHSGGRASSAGTAH